MYFESTCGEKFHIDIQLASSLTLPLPHTSSHLTDKSNSHSCTRIIMLRTGDKENYLFNSPVGYSKNPLEPLILSQTQHENLPTLMNEKPQLNGLDSLPFEVRAKIANELSQFDCLNLIRTNKAMYTSTMPRLYQHIVIDENYSQFNREISFKHYERPAEGNHGYVKENSCTFIKSSYSFRRLLTHYIVLYENKFKYCGPSYVNADNFPYIKTLKCIELPDSLNTYDHDLNDQISDFFTTLVHLRELVWLKDNFRLEYLNSLPNTNSIKTLILNIKFSNYLSELSTSPSAHSDAELISSVSSLKQLSFPQVTNFQIRPFQNSKRLQRIINNLLVCENTEQILYNLKVLKIARFDKDVNVLVPPCQELVSSNADSLSDLDLYTIRSLYESKLDYLPNLEVLLLNNCLLTLDDADLLIEKVNLSNLKTFELKNVSEYHRYHEREVSSHDRPEDSFLTRLVSHIDQLEHLALDFREAYTDTVWLFLSNLRSRKLKSLDLIIRYNDTKLHAFTTGDLYQCYAQALVSGYMTESVIKLSMEIKQENQFCDLVIPLPTNYFYDQIGRFKKLKSLRINPNVSQDHYEVLQLVGSLPRLTYLDVFGAQAGGAPNLGLGMVHPTIYDDWFKVQHVAIMYFQQNPHVKYIRINKCVFERKLEVVPRDGLDTWFSQLVRVGYGVDM